MARMAHTAARPDWPEAELETLGHCPLCQSNRRKEIYAGVGRPSEPGGWTLSRCRNCRCGYIDPRPNLATVGRLYSAYYTHVSPGNGGESAGLRKRILDGYLSRRYGYGRASSPLARLVPLIPGARGMASQHVRDLDAPRPGGRLLDVGCGNGAFLVRMRELGWEVSGLEVDPVSAAHARSAGVEVAEGPLVEGTFPANHFDAITLSHVIEHLHDPVATLRACRAVLKPGGRIWIATPNLDAVGRRALRRVWFPLDPPRHLVLFTRRSLRQALTAAGFTSVREPSPTLQATRWTFGASLDIERGGDGSTIHRLPRRQRLQALVADLATTISRSAGEELCMTATRPEA